MKLACSSPMVPGPTLTAKAERLRAWGYAGMSVFLDRDALTEEVRQEILTLEPRTGVACCELVLVGPIYGLLMDADPATRAAARAVYEEAASLCTAIGAVTSIEYEYRPQIPMPLFDPYQGLEGERRSDFVRIYRDVLAVVEGGPALVLLEPLNRYESRYLNAVADCASLVDEVAHPNAGLLFDFFHSSIEEAHLPDSIRAGGRLIRHVHLGDNNRLLPGRGTVDWEACFAALRDIGYDGYLSLECSPSGDPDATLPGAARFLAALM